MPSAPERALGFAHLAFAEAFNGTPEAGEHAQTAVQLAETCADPAAFIWALGTRAQTRWGTEEGVEDAERAFALAVDSGDLRLVCRFAIFLSNSYQSAGRYTDAADVTDRSYRTLLDAGQFDYAASVGGVAAWWNFILGRWEKVRPMVRELLTIARSDDNAGPARCVAALLTAHEGNSPAAAMHLRRARELMPTAALVGDVLAETEIQVNIALGHPLEALELIDRYMDEVVQIDPIAADEMLQHASRAAAYVVERDTGTGARQSAVRRLEMIETARGSEPAPFTPAGARDLVHPALGALHAAQRAQCTGADEGMVELWEAACTATAQADMEYEHARARYQLARHLLTHRLDKSTATKALVSARRIAGRLGAAPLVEDIDTLAAQAHLQIVSVGFGGSGSRRATPTLPANPPLTARERQVLDGLLSGETYAQIATRLFISDKTVSSHVSNLLRKTGTASRIELADLAHRSQCPDGS